MEKVVSVVGDYWVYASVDEVSNPSGLVRLAFSTKLVTAKDPTRKQVKFEMYLTKQELEELKSIM